MRFVSKSAAAFAAAAAVFCSLQAADASVATYRLHNHPDGDASPPQYGLRLDELYNVTSGHDVFTFDFNNAASSVFLMYDDVAQTILIEGVAFGGRDTGSGYANDAYRGVYSVSFLYTIGVGTIPGDDDLGVNGANHANTGLITTPGGDLIPLFDERGGNAFSFRLGDESNDQGHRGFDGTSGWGWINHHTEGNHISDGDWLFTAELVSVPTPGAGALLAMSGILAARRRRR